jgi:hypothetical protein
LSFRRVLPLFILTLVALGLLAYAPSGASDENRVALVVDFGDEVATRCVSFAEEEITGYQVLERSGLPIETDFQAGGAAVCRIDDTGCPSDDCFCSCRGGGDCVYWSYWHLVAGAWQYSMGGSGQYMVSDGAVEGWVWGLGSVIQASPPPLVSFTEVCTDPAGGVSSPTPSLTPTPIIIRSATPVESNPTQPPTATSTTSPTGAPTQTGTPTQAGATSTLPTASAAASATTSVGGLIGQTALLASTAAVLTQPAQPGGVGAAGESEAADPATAPQPATATPLTPARTTLPAQTATIEYSLSLDSAPAIASSPATTAPPAVPEIAAVVGDGHTVASGVPTTSGSASVPAGQTAESANLISYAGFAGLLLLLGALAMVVYRRKGGG